MSEIIIKNLNKSYGDNKVINAFNIKITDGEFIVLVGPSGCGKSTLLRMISGLETVDEGEIFLDNKLINNLIPSKRGIAMVFQSYALYPHMNVYENMSFGLKMEKHSKSDIEKKVNEAAKTLQIQDLLDRKPKELSGGQRQRVAIGRAITRNPKLFLFDEPLSNLDAALRSEMRVEISKLHKKMNSNIIYVTHDQVEAMTLADKIVVLRHGNIEQIGSPIELYRNPSNMFVAQFIGSPKMNFFDSDDLTVAGRALIKSGADILGIRPEHFIVSDTGVSIVEGTPNLVEHLGEYALVHCESQVGRQFIVKTTDPEQIVKGSLIEFDVSAEYTHSFDSNTKSIIA